MGVKTLDFGEHKRRCLTLAKKRSYENELLHQTLESIIFGALI